ncbi:MAG: type II secretion system F family protein [Negativicutes bacterium]|nr:type II secretion system F family protein [Negativicutes bacterium]
MLMLISITAFINIIVIVYALLAVVSPARGEVTVRLKALDAITVAGYGHLDEELAKPFAQRVISPLTGSLAGGLVRFTPAALRRRVDSKLAAAGGFSGLSTDGFLLLCAFVGASGVVVGGGLTAITGAPAGKVVFEAILGLAIGAVVPMMLLNRKIAARRKNIQSDLPDALDLLTVSVEAGLGFDGALAKLAEKMKGPLVEEFSRTLQEMRIGVPRRDAIRAMGQRCNVADLSLFTAAVVQADQLGVSIGNVLRVQSAAMRDKRRQRAQEKAHKAPVKMLIPLVVFIFPAIFVVVLGPAVIRLMSSLLFR